MLVILSPAKTLDLETSFSKDVDSTQPFFLEQAQTLIKGLRKLTLTQIEKLMKVSPKLAELNFERFQEWSLPFSNKNSRPSIFTFMGDVYKGLDVYTLSSSDFKFMQERIGILSGLYGFLKPFDLIQPYRLEMGTSFKNERGVNLYAFWKNQIRTFLEQECSDTWVNLASNEYYKVISQERIQKKVIMPVFKDEKNGVLKVISFYAKKARGMMTRYIVQNRIDAPDGLKDFQDQGYVFDLKLSTEEQYIFTRKENYL